MVTLPCTQTYKNETNNDVLKQNAVVQAIIGSLQLNNYPGITLFVNRKVLYLYDVAKLHIMPNENRGKYLNMYKVLEILV